MKKIIALLLTLCLVLSLGACGGKATVEGKGYDTPEEAIVAYAEALKSGDMAKIMAVHAVETYVDRYDLEEYIDKVRVYNNAMDCPMPNTDAHTRQMNIVFRQNTIARQQQYLYLYVAFGEPYEPVPITVHENGDYTSTSKFLRELTQEEWLEILAEMEVGDVGDYRDVDIEKDTWKNTQKKVYSDMEKYLGCDEVTGLALEITLDGEDYYLCADLVCYGGKWYVYKVGSTIGSLASADNMTGLLPR